MMHANRGIRLVVSLICSSVLTIGIFGNSIAGAVITKPAVVVYGDSLTWESTTRVLAAIPSTTFADHVHAVSGTAVCDWVQWLPVDISKWHPKVITLATAGNSFTPCMYDPATGSPYPWNSPGYLAKYQSDLRAFFSIATGSGAKVVFSEGPPMPYANWDAGIISIANIAQNLIANEFPTVIFSNAARLAVSNNGAFVSSLPCLTGETKAKGCLNGLIDVRTTNPNGLDYLVHLCPHGITSAPDGCDIYSSGEFRYGTAIGQATTAAGS